MSIFYDSARSGLIPTGADAALYVDGRYKVTPQQAKRFGRTRWITVLGGSAVAAEAGAADFEAGNSVHDIPGKLRSWALERQAMNCRARVYCDRADLGKALSLVGDLPNVCFWLATLDGKPWDAAELLAEIKAAYRIALKLERLWGIQYEGGMTAPYDKSILVGAW
jgi:hypothetical protein